MTTATDIESIIYSEEFQHAFISGFSDASPAWYDVETDGMSPNPWCAPWEWAHVEDFYHPELGDAEAMGRAWAEKHYTEMEKLHEEELEEDA